MHILHPASESRQSHRLDFLIGKPLILEAGAHHTSSDAGMFLFAAMDKRIGLCAQLGAAYSQDPRSRRGKRDWQPQLGFAGLLRQRVLGMLCAYEDCNDHDRLRSDPAMTTAMGFAEKQELAAQPTLSRFENAMSWNTLPKMVAIVRKHAALQVVEANDRQLPSTITLDLDTTDDPCHGHQQLALFHGYYEQNQYLPLIISEQKSRAVLSAWLRPGTLAPSCGFEDDLTDVVSELQKHRSDVTIHVRADSAMGSGRVMEWLENNGFGYTIGLARNPALKRKAEPFVQEVAAAFAATGQMQTHYFSFWHRAETAEHWEKDRRVVLKVEVDKSGTHMHMIATSLPVETPAEAQTVYEDYALRGESEQRHAELKNGLKMDRLSCSRFRANFMRLIEHWAAYTVFNALRNLKGVPAWLKAATPESWVSRVIKAGCQIVRSARRIVVRVSESWPGWLDFTRVASAVLAT